MKLHTLSIFLFAVGMLASCSTEDSQLLNIDPQAAIANRPTPNQPIQGLRIKKVTQVTYYSSSPPDTDVTDFFYNGNRLDSTQTTNAFSNYSSHFHYNGLKVTYVESFDDGQPDGISTINYIGDDISHTQSATGRTDYTYSGGHVRTIKSYGISGPNLQLFESRTFTYSGNNIGEELRETFFVGSYVSRNVYTYDAGNNPTKGMNKYLRLLLRSEGFNGLSDNNPLTQSSYAPVDSTTPVSQYYVVQYNSRNYPLNIKRYYQGNDFLISDTTIQYE